MRVQSIKTTTMNNRQRVNNKQQNNSKPHFGTVSLRLEVELTNRMKKAIQEYGLEHLIKYRNMLEGAIEKARSNRFFNIDFNHERTHIVIIDGKGEAIEGTYTELPDYAPSLGIELEIKVKEAAELTAKLEKSMDETRQKTLSKLGPNEIPF